MNPAEIDEHSIFDHVYKFVPIGIAFVSLEGAWLNVNPALCNILGYSKEELLQLTFQELTHPVDLELNHSIVRRLIIGEVSSCELEKRYIQKNGNVIWASLHFSLVRHEIDEPLCISLLISSIYRKKKRPSKSCWKRKGSTSLFPRTHRISFHSVRPMGLCNIAPLRSSTY